MLEMISLDYKNEQVFSFKITPKYNFIAVCLDEGELNHVQTQRIYVALKLTKTTQ